MKRAHVLGQIVFKFLPDVTHALDHFFGVLGEAQRGRCGD